MPQLDVSLTEFESLVLPNQTWAIDFENNLVTTHITDKEAVRQTAALILETERYEYEIFSHEYGTELFSLFGENMLFVMSEVKRRVTEALTQDDRITSVDNFEFTRDKHTLRVTFTVTSNVGNFDAETAVTL